jgi:hypothetical protein
MNSDNLVAVLAVAAAVPLSVILFPSSRCSCCDRPLKA